MKTKVKAIKKTKTSANMVAISKNYIATDFYGSMNRATKKMSDSLYYRVMRGIANVR